MTSEIFQEWLITFNNKMKSMNRFVVLLYDNAGGHNLPVCFMSKLTNVKVSELQENSKIQTKIDKFLM